MAKPTELPNLIREFVDLAKAYLRQETVERAKQLGRFAKFALSAGVVFAFGAFFLSIAGLRWLLHLLPGSANWQAFGYLVASLSLIAIAALVVWAGARESGEGR